MLYTRVVIVLICLQLSAPVLACPAMVFTGSKSSGHKTRHDKKEKRETSNSQGKTENPERNREARA